MMCTQSRNEQTCLPVHPMHYLFGFLRSADVGYDLFFVPNHNQTMHNHNLPNSGLALQLRHAQACTGRDGAFRYLKKNRKDSGGGGGWRRKKSTACFKLNAYLSRVSTRMHSVWQPTWSACLIAKSVEMHMGGISWGAQQATAERFTTELSRDAALSSRINMAPFCIKIFKFEKKKTKARRLRKAGATAGSPKNLFSGRPSPCQSDTHPCPVQMLVLTSEEEEEGEGTPLTAVMVPPLPFFLYACGTFVHLPSKMGNPHQATMHIH